MRRLPSARTFICSSQWQKADSVTVYTVLQRFGDYIIVKAGVLRWGTNLGSTLLKPWTLPFVLTSWRSRIFPSFLQFKDQTIPWLSYEGVNISCRVSDCMLTHDVSVYVHDCTCTCPTCSNTRTAQTHVRVLQSSHLLIRSALTMQIARGCCGTGLISSAAAAAPLDLEPQALTPDTLTEHSYSVWWWRFFHSS